MTRTHRSLSARLRLGTLLLSLALFPLAARAAAPEVAPADLSRRADLLGRDVLVDARTKGTFAFHRDRGFDEFLVQGSPVIFRLPAHLSYPSPPKAPVVRVEGVLRKEDGHIVCDVRALQIMPTDLERLDQAVAALAPEDAKARDAWAQWGERRGAEYRDEALKARAREIAAEAIRIEAARPGADRLALAARARTRFIPEPFPSALAHGAFRAKVDAAATPEALEALALAIAGFLPGAKQPAPAGLPPVTAPYQADPEGIYGKGEAGFRAALDRRLLADAIAKALLLKAEAAPKEALLLAADARTRIPDRPDVLAKLQNIGLGAADVSSLRQSEVEEYAKMYEKAGQPKKARDFIRRWLDDQRVHVLTPTDAEGRVALAGQYESMLGDRSIAQELLREAWAIDPQSKETADAFRRRGYRLEKGEWHLASPAAATKASPDDDPAPRNPADDPLIGLTRKDVQAQQGRPKRIARTLVQGQLREQWIYDAGAQRHYINFVQRPGMLDGIVASHKIAP